jgi:hypothetical protein
LHFIRAPDVLYNYWFVLKLQGGDGGWHRHGHHPGADQAHRRAMESSRNYAGSGDFNGYVNSIVLRGEAFAKEVADGIHKMLVSDNTSVRLSEMEKALPPRPRPF